MRFFLLITFFLVTHIGAIGQAAFDYNSSSGNFCAPAEILCTDLSTGATAWEWLVTGPETFSSNVQNPGFTFLSPGTYIISLTINGGSSTAEQTIYMAGDYGVSASVNPLEICVDETVNGSAVASSPGVSFHWFFHANSSNPTIGSASDGYVFGGVGTTSDVSYQYQDWSQPARVILLVDSAGCIQNAFTEDVNVAPPSARFSFQEYCAAAQFNINANQAVIADEFVWRIIGGPDAGPDPIHTATTPQEGNFFHTFTNPGEHTVELYVSSSFTGCSDTYSAVVTSVDVTPDVSITPMLAEVGDTIRFQNFNSSIDSISYNFGTGDSSGFVPGWQEVTTVYSTPGVYQIRAVSEIYEIEFSTLTICTSNIIVGTITIGDANTIISGKVFNDVSGNGIYDAGDEVFAGVPLVLQPDNRIYYTNASGDYLAGTSTPGAHTLSPSPIYGLDCGGQSIFENTVPGILPFQFDYAGDAAISQDFAYINSPTPCRTITGVVFEDVNQNGIKDAGEAGIANRVISLDGDIVTRTNGGGDFTLELPENQSGTLTCDANVYNSNYCNIVITEYEQTLPENDAGYQIAAQSGNLESLDFGFSATEETSFDVGLYSLVVYNGTAAGEAFLAFMDFKANGNIENPCTLRIVHSPLVTLLEASIPPTAQSATEVEWVFLPGFAPSWYCMEMNWFLDSMAVQGEQLHWEATYNCPPDEDACPSNDQIIRNVTILSGPVRLAQDPAKLYSVRPEGFMPEVVGHEVTLSYEVLYDNPLDAPLYALLLIDTLPDAIDVSSISYPFSSLDEISMCIEDNGIIYITADATGEAIKETGFIQFNAKLKDGLADGTTFKNSATLFFNGTNPTATNTVLHRLDQAVPVKDVFANHILATIFPNPMTDQMILKLTGDPSLNYDAKIVDLMGRTLRTYQHISSELLIERKGLPPGLYLLHLNEAGQSESSASLRFVVR